MPSARPSITPDSVVDDVMRTWPSTIRVFLDFHMSCVGCSIGPFHTIRDSCVAHGIEMDALLTALQRTHDA
jgi:hybrid cluster-associated redox disulfide protein